MFGPVNGYVSLPIDENVIKEAVARIGPIAIGLSLYHDTIHTFIIPNHINVFLM